MPTAYIGDRKSRKVKKRRERDTRNAIRQVANGIEFSASYVSDLLEKADLRDKCVVDMGQYLKDEARSKIWILCTKTTGTPRYRLIDGGIESLEVLEGINSKMEKEATMTIEQRMELVKSPDEPFSTVNFSKDASGVKAFIEAFGVVLGKDDAITITWAKEVLKKSCGLQDVRENIPGKIIAGLLKDTTARPAFLELRGYNGKNEKMVTLTTTGQRVAKGTWGLRDSPGGVKVYNFASGCFVKKKELELTEPFNPPRRAESPPVSEGSREPVQEPSQQQEIPFRVVGPEPKTEAAEGASRVSQDQSGTVRFIFPKPSSDSHKEFYTARAAQRLFDVLVSECHPADYESVIESLVQKLTGNKEISLFKDARR